MTPIDALIEFLAGERRPISRATLLTWIARHERIRKDWPSLTVDQWEKVLENALEEMLVNEADGMLFLPSEKPLKKDTQGSFFD